MLVETTFAKLPLEGLEGFCRVLGHAKAVQMQVPQISQHLWRASVCCLQLQPTSNGNRQKQKSSLRVRCTLTYVPSSSCVPS